MNPTQNNQSIAASSGSVSANKSTTAFANNVSDLELLARFVEQNDHSAMTAIIARHGPLVMGVCRRFLTSEHDASDAFQATFLVLLKKAKSLRGLKSLAAWLYGVAHRVARKSRSQSTLRRQREGSELIMTPEAISAERLDPETIDLIHVELARMPEKYQLPLILCYLEGRDREAVAEQLGWTIGSLKGRLERAREMLSVCLKRRGVIVPAALLTAAMTKSALADVPLALASTTVNSLALVVAGQTFVGATGSIQTASLAQGVLKAMLLTKLKISSVVIVVGLMASGGTAVVLQNAFANSGKVVEANKQNGDEKNSQVQVALNEDKKDEKKEEQKEPVQDEERLKLRREQMNNFKQLGLAMHNYASANGTFPPAAIYGKGDKPLLSWRVLLLPYIDQEALYKQFKLDEPWDSPNNKKLLSKMPAIYRAPTQKNENVDNTFTQVFTGKGTAFDGKKGMTLQAVKDGLSFTILIAEAGKAVPWTKPADLEFDANKPLPKLSGVFPDGFCSCMGDGSARFVAKDISDADLRPWITANAGDTATAF